MTTTVAQTDPTPAGPHPAVGPTPLGLVPAAGQSPPNLGPSGQVAGVTRYDLTA